MATPIWHDYTVDLGTTDGQAFTIYDKADNTGNVIYKGKAYIKPGQSHAYVKVNDICADYLAQKLSLSFVFTGYSYETFPGALTFSCYKDSTFVASWTFYLNYEYKDSGTDKIKLRPNMPVTGRIMRGMPFCITRLYPSASAAARLLLYALPGSSSTTYNIDVQGSVNLWAKANNDNPDYEITVAEYKDTTNSIDYNLALQLIDKCHRYALYYVNSMGGLDFLVIEGSWRMKDGYDGKTYKQTYDNGNLANRGTVDYHNDITRTWELHTGWLTDVQAGRMGDLLGSPLVFLCDCDDNYQLHPVTITNGDCPYKRYRKDGMVEYGINVELARNITRR